MSDSGKAVFLSYASQDAEAAKRIADALRAAGVEVWFDQSELVGGDQWDGKIRGQISSCALFVPIISANTQARLEGYFRLEWKLAAQRTHTMADEKTFLLPVVIDTTRDQEAKVPAEFKAVQWTRLPGGVTPPGFATRVQKLLDGSEMETGSPHPAKCGEGAVSPVKRGFSKWWWALPVFGVTMALMLVMKESRSGTPAQSVAPALSPARQLAERARQLRSFNGLTREKLGAAEDLLDEALKLDPGEPEAWAVAAQVDVLMLHRGWDNSDAREQSAAKRVSRALALAADGFEPRHAQAVLAGFLIRTKESHAEAETIYRALLKEQPDNRDLLEELGTLLQGSGRYDEAAGLFQRAGRPVLAGSVYYAAKRFEEARRVADELLAGKRTTEALALKANVELFGFNDRGAAQAAVNQLTPTELREDDAAAIALRLAVLSSDAAGILKLLEPYPRPFVSIGVDYPRQYWTGIARMIQHQPEAAAIEWRGALRSLEERMQAKPNDTLAMSWAGILKARLGDREGAERLIRLYRNYVDLSQGEWDWNYCFIILSLGDRNEEVVDRLEKSMRNPKRTFNNILYAWARFSPEFDPVRGNPRFEKLLRDVLPKGATPFEDRKTAGADRTVDGSSSAKASTDAKAMADKSEDKPGLPAAPDLKSVAVLAFANLSDDKGNEYFSDGISEELLNVLAKIPGLKVTARTSSFHFKGKDTSIPEIARQLGVAYVIEGSVRKQGDRVRITAQLIKAADGFHVWSDTFTRDLKDIFAVQDEIAGLIAQQLQLKLGESTRVAKVVNPEAYRLLLEGRQFWNLRSEEGFTKAEAAFTKALALDPQFAEAHAGLGGVCVIRAVYRELDDVPLEANDLARAVSEGRRALEIDPASADALAVLAYAQMMGNQLAESDRNFQQALTLNPNSALVHCWYALLLNAEGRLDASLVHYQKAAEVDPLWFINLHMMGNALVLAQRYNQALGISERAEALRTEVFLPTKSQRARALLALGRKEEAFTAARQILRNPDLRPRWDSDAIAIHLLWAGGRRQEAENEGARLLASYPQESYLRGFILAALGRFDEALPFLQHTPSVMGWRIYGDTLWDPWRDDPRFLQLMAHLGRAEEYKVARETLARMLKEQEGKK